MRPVRWLIGLLVAALVIALVGLGLSLYFDATKRPAPWAERCGATVTGATVVVDLEQAHYSSIITGVAARRGLAPRAATIALATAYQESGIHNLDYGDRDSLGLFQQRPSQAWGTPEQIMDPYYASRAFYSVMETVKDWDSRDIGDVAQRVQRSGYPDAYDKHVQNARRLASSLAGETPASFSCALRDVPAGDPAAARAFLTRTLPESDVITAEGKRVEVRARNTKNAWQAAHVAVANAKRLGVAEVSVGARSWRPQAIELAPWRGDADAATRVVITLK